MLLIWRLHYFGIVQKKKQKHQYCNQEDLTFDNYAVVDWPDIEGFTWEEYLVKTKSSPVPARAFKNVSVVNVSLKSYPSSGGSRER